MTGDFLRTSEAHCVCRCSFVLMSFVQKIEKYQVSFFFVFYRKTNEALHPGKPCPFQSHVGFPNIIGIRGLHFMKYSNYPSYLWKIRFNEHLSCEGS